MVLMMRPSSASARASRVGLLFVCSVRMSPEACATPSFNEPARRSRSSHCSAMILVLMRSEPAD